MAYEPLQVLKAVTYILDNCGPRPQLALRVWAALQLDAGPDIEMVIDREHVARHAGVSIGDVSRAIPSLVNAGVLMRVVRRNTQRGGGPSPRGRSPTIVKMHKFW